MNSEIAVGLAVRVYLKSELQEVASRLGSGESSLAAPTALFPAPRPEEPSVSLGGSVPGRAAPAATRGAAEYGESGRVVYRVVFSEIQHSAGDCQNTPAHHEEAPAAMKTAGARAQERIGFPCSKTQ